MLGQVVYVLLYRDLRGFFLFVIIFVLLTLQLPQPCLSSLVEQEKALMVVLGLLSFPFD